MARPIYYVQGTPITFQDSGGSAVLTLNNLAPFTGRLSARYDRGASARAALHEVRGIMQYRTAPIVGESVEIWVSESDGTYADAAVGTADAAYSPAQMLNLRRPVCTVRAQTVGTSVDNIASGLVWIFSRYFSVIVTNLSAGDNLRNTANTSRVIVTPIIAEIQ